MRLSFEQAMEGAEVPVVVPKQATCPTCRGAGAKPGTSPIICPRCGGSGIDSESQGFFSISQPCPRCGGSGEVIEHPCETCGGSGLTMQRKRYRVKVPPGVRDGSRIRVAGKGEDGPRGGPPGDLYVVTRVTPSPVFKQRADGNLEVTVPITIAEAIQGATVEVPTLNGTKRIRIPAGTQHGTVQRLRGEGPPKPGRAGPRRHPLPARDRGPADLSSEQKQALGEFAKAMNDHDPRERLLRDASASSDKVQELRAMAKRDTRPRQGRDRQRARRVHDLGRRGARRDASADAAHVRGARADHAEALAEEHPPVLARTSSGCAASSG